MLRTVARAGLWIPKRIGKLLRPGALSLFAAAANALRRGNVGRGLLLAGLALVSTVFKRLALPVYALLVFNKLRKQLQSARRGQTG